MRKGLGALLLVLAMLACSGLALGDEAADITGQCKIKTTSTKFKVTQMTDGKYTSVWKGAKVKHSSVALTAPGGSPIYGVYVCFATMPDSYEFQVLQGSDWVPYAEGDTRFYHVYQPIPEGAAGVRVYVKDDSAFALYINEIFAFGPGDVPEWVQRWEPFEGEADVLFISTHPDDELIFFGGGIPTYAGELKKNVVVAYMSYSNTTRRSELLNSLWYLGVRTYPDISGFRDSYQKNLPAQYKALGGEDKVNAWAVSLLRKYKPAVVVTQAEDGEYGHPMHKVAAAAVLKAWDTAGDPGIDPDSANLYGVWQPQKLYLHLWPENRITMNWETPLSAFGGKTGLELADEAYRTYHITQRASGMSVTETGSKYDNHIFGLARTTVGYDAVGGDFLENIGAPAEPVMPELIPAEEPAAPAEEEVLPEEGELIAEEGALLPEEGELIAEEGALLPEEGELVAEEGALLPGEGELVAEEGAALPAVEPVPAETPAPQTAPAMPAMVDDGEFVMPLLIGTPIPATPGPTAAPAPAAPAVTAAPAANAAPVLHAEIIGGADAPTSIILTDGLAPEEGEGLLAEEGSLLPEEGGLIAEEGAFAAEAEAAGSESAEAAPAQEAQETQAAAGPVASAYSAVTYDLPYEVSSRLPALNARGYLDEGEFVIADETNGLYVYINPTLKVIIQRKTDTETDKKHPLVWFDAEIWADVAAGTRLETLQVDPEKMGKARDKAYKTATKYKSVFATNTDYYTYRLGSTRPIGIVIRDGKILYEKRYSKETTNFPNLDTLAFYPDGTLASWFSFEKEAQAYLDEGAYNVYSFGPCLVKNGELTERALNANASYNPRYAIGMVEPGHYVAILCEGRLKRSKGVQMLHLAQMMQERGCSMAINLDGGQTCIMCFMGQQINQIPRINNSNEVRSTSEILAIGTSDLVGTVQFE